MVDDTLELREQLEQAWRAVLDGAIDRGMPIQAVIETMASTAHERFADVFGAAAAASYLALLAEQLRADDRSETLDLIQGKPAVQPIAQADPDEEISIRFDTADLI